RVGRPGLDLRCRNADLVGQQFWQSGLGGQGHDRKQPGARHEMLIIEHRRLRGEPMRNLHRECLSELIRLMPREHQSFQLRGHFPRYDTRWPANSSTDRGLGSRLIRIVLDRAAAEGKPLVLNVLEVNRRAYELYRRLGFTEDRRFVEGPAVKIRMVAGE